MSTSTAGARPACDHRPDWRDHAACRDADPELLFPDGGIGTAWARVKTAKLICRGCPVTTTCLSWALASGQEHGIWGGLTEDERRRLHRRGRSWGAGRWPVLSARGSWPGPACADTHQRALGYPHARLTMRGKP